jgi:lipid A ethanolaminephosphotransferase
MLRPTIAARFETVAIAVAAYIVVFLNLPFWTRLISAVAPGTANELVFLAVVGVIVWLLMALALSAFALPYVFKPVAIATICVSVAASYFMREYGTVIDSGMITNVLQTDRGEAADLITARFILHMALWAGVPVIALALIQLHARPFWSEVRFRLISGVAIMAVCAGLAYPFLQNIGSVFREHTILKHEITPFNVVSGLRRALVMQAAASRTRTVAAFGQDARRVEPVASPSAKSITVLVVGETARSQNFSLNGYARVTNPQLAAVSGLVSFADVASCGTATAQSLPCMFSGVGQAAAQTGIAMQQEGLLDVLQRAGYSMLWRDNQSGCKGVCFRVPHESVMTAEPTKFYELAISYDEKLLVGLQDWIDKVPDRGVVVLHMMGNHGPAYFKRYPPAFEVFKPACHETQFSKCTRDEIVNAYDNALVYTDHVLAKLIEMLTANDARGTATALMYLSDHGESLGEKGIYLHGLPYALAPAEQKQVPWIWWLSPRFERAAAVSSDCLQQHVKDKLSHDHFFHSVLGLLGVTTRVYNPALDVTETCRRKTVLD